MKNYTLLTQSTLSADAERVYQYTQNSTLQQLIRVIFPASEIRKESKLYINFVLNIILHEFVSKCIETFLV